MLDRKVAFYAPGGGTKSFTDGLGLLDEGSLTHEIYERVFIATDIDVLDICRRKEPVITPAALQVASVAIGYARSQALNEQGIFADYVLGVSSGEFTAAAVANAVSVERAAKMSKQRGLSQAEEAGGLGGAYLVIHDRKARARKLRHKIRTSLTDFQASQLSGEHTPYRSLVTYFHEEAEAVKHNLETITGVKRVIDMANIGYPPHGGLLGDTERIVGHAVDELIKEGGIKDSTIEIIATRTARPMRKAKTIGRNLVLQTTRPTKLESGVYYVVNRGVLDHYDLGPGNSMSNLLEDFDLGAEAVIHPVGSYDRPGVSS